MIEENKYKRWQLSYQEVCDYFEKYGCVLLENNYQNCRCSMQYRCKCGSIDNKTFQVFKMAPQCKKCSCKQLSEKRRCPFEKVYSYFRQYNCELLSRVYENEREKMLFKCKCGKIDEITFRTFKESHQCSQCSKKCIGDGNRLSYEKVKQIYEDYNCKLVETVYIDCKREMKFECSCGNIDSKSFLLFKICPKCSKCKSKESSERRKFEYKDVKKIFEQKSCILLSETYENSWTLLKYVCKCGNEQYVSFSDFIRKDRKGCKICQAINFSGSNNPFWQPDREKLKENRKFRSTIRNLLTCTLKMTGMKKNTKTEKMLGYTWIDFKNYIENHPNWNSVKNLRWHIDHIFPIQAFVDYNIKDPKLINCLGNLRPLDAHSNLTKNCKYNKEEFEKWLISKNIELPNAVQVAAL
jgi:hypothetical protein